MSDPLPLEWDCASCLALRAEIERLRALHTEVIAQMRAALLYDKNARTERLETALMKARKFIDYELPSRGKTMLVAELDAALAGKEGT